MHRQFGIDLLAEGLSIFSFLFLYMLEMKFASYCSNLKNATPRSDFIQVSLLGFEFSLGKYAFEVT